MDRRSKHGAVIVAAALAVLATFGAVGFAAAAPSEVVVRLTGEAVGRVEIAPGGIAHFRAEVGDHDIVADDGTWRTGVIWEGETVSISFHSPGEYAFHCTLHPDERGVIAAVEDAPPPPPPPPPENQPPTASIAAPADGATVPAGPVVVRVAASDPDAGPEPLVVNVRVDGGEWVRMTQADGAWTWTWDASGAAAGGHLIEAVAQDGRAASPVASSRVTVTRDEPMPPSPTPTPPPPGKGSGLMVRIEAPADESELTPGVDVVVLGTVADSDEKAQHFRVQVRVDDGDWRSARGGREWTFVWTAAEVQPGPHLISVRASDDDGETWSEPVGVRVTVRAIDGFIPPTPTPPPVTSNGDWGKALLDFGWVAVAALVVAGAWTWASSRP